MEQPSRPPYRPAQTITSAELHAALSSGDVERIHFALIDGSRCLSDEEVYAHALPLVNHDNPRVRWAAVFAVDQCRKCMPDLLNDGFEPIFALVNLATSDPDEAVRHIAGMTLGDIIALLVGRQRDAKAP